MKIIGGDSKMANEDILIDTVISKIINVKYIISFIPNISDMTLNSLNSELNEIIEILQR